MFPVVSEKHVYFFDLSVKLHFHISVRAICAFCDFL